MAPAHALTTLRVDRPTLYAIAAEADCDVRTADRALRGARLRGRVRERLERVLAARGITPPQNAAETTNP